MVSWLCTASNKFHGVSTTTAMTGSILNRGSAVHPTHSFACHHFHAPLRLLSSSLGDSVFNMFLKSSLLIAIATFGSIAQHNLPASWADAPSATGPAYSPSIISFDACKTELALAIP